MVLTPSVLLNYGVGAISSAVNYVIGAINSAVNYGVGAISSAVNYGVDAISSAVNYGVDAISSAVNYGVGAISSAVNHGVDAISSAVNSPKFGVTIFHRLEDSLSILQTLKVGDIRLLRNGGMFLPVKVASHKTVFTGPGLMSDGTNKLNASHTRPKIFPICRRILKLLGARRLTGSKFLNETPTNFSRHGTKSSR
jgi:predicted component of type VI protein secretion system